MSLLKCTDVTLAYEGKIVCKDLNFSVNRGDYLCMIGENGSGKSTLMKGLLNLKTLTSGSIQFAAGMTRREIGYVPQQTLVQRDFPATVWEIVSTGMLNQRKLPFLKRKNEKDIITFQLDRLGIGALKDCCYKELSGGQQQRVLLARALCATQSILLLDEPVTGLDPLVTEELYKIILELNQNHNITIIMVTHDLQAVEKYASHVLCLEENHYFYGSKQKFITEVLPNMYFGRKK